MQLATTRYRANTPAVIHESFGLEAVVVHLESGMYYRLSGFAAELWPMLARGRNALELPDLLLARYEADRERLDREARGLVEEFSRERLILPRGEEPAEPEPDFEAAERRPFVELGYEKFADMEEMLMLDPVHESGEQGWLGGRA